MKMEFDVTASQGGRVAMWLAEPGAVVGEGQPLLAIDPSEDDGQVHDAQAQVLDPDAFMYSELDLR